MENYAWAILQAERLKIEVQLTSIQNLMEKLQNSEDESDKWRWSVWYERSDELFQMLVSLDHGIALLTATNNQDEA